MALRLSLTEKFTRPPLLNASIGVAANLDWEILGTNAANAGSTLSTGGGIDLATAGAQNDQIIVLPHQDAGQSTWAGTTWNSDRMIGAKFSLRIVTAASLVMAVGIRSTTTSLDVATDNDKVIFRTASATDGFWHVVESIGGTDTDTATSVAVAAGNIDFTLEIQADRTCICKINGVVVRVTAALTANTDLGEPYAGLQSTAGAAANFRVHYIGATLNPAA